MIWVIVFAAIGVAGLLMLIGYAIWLAHKTSDLFAEMKVLGKRGGEFARIAGQIRMPDQASEAAAGVTTTSMMRPAPTAKNAVGQRSGGTGPTGGLSEESADDTARDDSTPTAMDGVS